MIHPRRPLVALLAMGALLLSGCFASAPTAGDSSSEADPGVAHVHGLGVDPADGVLYAATHFGLFRIPDAGPATRVADRFQDTMGFTIAGLGDFLGSGHPDLREDRPARLGLISSGDRGENWTPLSLSGETDFHALHAVQGVVYGWDAGSGRLMASTDRTTWQTRSTLGLLDFAVNPSDPQVLLATTQDGLARSTDGGRTFRAGGPAAAYLAWPSAELLYAVSPVGIVSVSADGGSTWDARGRLSGQPQAFTVVGTTSYAAVSGDGIYQSTDGGRTFTARYRYSQGKN